MLKVLVSETSTGTVKLTSVQTTSTPAEQTTSGETNEEIEDANDFVDQILEEVQTSEAIQAKITPAVLGDLHYNGFKLSNAVLHGVNSVYRSDNCTFHFSDTSFDVLVHLGAKDLHLESGWSRTWLYIPFGGHVGAKLRDVSIFMDINVGKDGAPTLRRLKLYNLPDLERRGDINMSLHLLSGNATLGGGLGLTKILVGSKYSYNPFFNLKMSGDVDVEIYDVAARMSFTVNMFKVRGHFELFKVGLFSHILTSRVY
ncbi:hypothetical protein HPB47_007230 [Ixodes persulcatus]|uniref:Uncharacterized protein n=1 Tax=Ixodes persulcatus TaxID=34615 RepID=A0AC60P880_IXOPE|nr:hypothetical protein HPB47_007230 [Ixodes persulcatus]